MHQLSHLSVSWSSFNHISYRFTSQGVTGSLLYCLNGLTVHHLMVKEVLRIHTHIHILLDSILILFVNKIYSIIFKEPQREQSITVFMCNTEGFK